MFIVRIRGGLGNQMCQYAFYKEIKCLAEKRKMNIRGGYS